jgi:hypothetical protein
VREYRSELFKFAKEIPWISPTLTPKNVPKFLKGIIEYYKDCEDHHKVDFKPKWQERKELLIKEKMLKIEKAEKRLKACRERFGDLGKIDDDLSLHKDCKQISSNVAQNPNSRLSSSSKAASAVAEGDKQIDSDHVCCPHCCVNANDCPSYQKNGTSDFCKLDRYDMIVECLLRKGYPKQELIEGNPESILYSENYNSDSEVEKEELDDNDIPEQDLHLYIKTESEVDQAKVLISNITP